MPAPIAAQTLAYDPDGGIRVRPEHIRVALRQLAGVADHPHSQQFPLKVKAEETLTGLWT